MYPAETSLIPVTIALTRFLEEKGFWQEISSNYPYWYLGTTPFRYLTGPILPGLLVGLHRLLPFYSLFDLFWGLLILGALGGLGGLYLLIKKLGGETKIALLAVVLFIFLPLIPFLFRFGDGLYTLAFDFVPYVLLSEVDFLERKGKNNLQLLINITFLLWLDVVILPQLVLGMVITFLAINGWEKAEERLLGLLKVFLGACLLATLWYTPGYWIKVLIAPSFSGKPLITLIGQIGQIIGVGLALSLAFFTAKIAKLDNSLKKFTFYWLFIFGLLTLLRFIADWDFWQDWSAYYHELQLGLALFLAIWMIKQKRTSIRIVYVCIILIIGVITVNKYIFKTMVRDKKELLGYRLGQELSNKMAKEDTVFLSGTSVFWLNSFFDIRQLRGGIDQASVNPDWRKAAWEIREGEDIAKTLTWCKDLNIRWIVIHSKASQEYYQDFKYPEKFMGRTELVKVYDQAGDRIYRISNIKN